MVRLRMLSLARLRCLGPVLLGLFVLAQVTAMVPLLSTHIQHALETEQDIAADLRESGGINHIHHHHLRHDRAQHKHSTNDPNDQCCTLHHHLAGVMPIASGANVSSSTITIVVLPPRSLVGIDPSKLERPPKLPLSV
jgi:ABC-type nickel/cobalt efflux system permease component RcnA